MSLMVVVNVAILLVAAVNLYIVGVFFVGLLRQRRYERQREEWRAFWASR